MYKRFLSPLLGLVAAALLFSSNAPAFDEGIEYKKLSRPHPTESGDKIEVLELFWYGCPHCFHLEPEIQRWLAGEPGDVVFRRMPAVLGANWVNHAKTFFAAELLGVLEQVHEPFFDALHNKKQRLFNADSIADWMAENGVDRAEFLKAYNSFIVDMKVRRAMQASRRFGIDGVPALVINGKYVTSPTLTGGTAKMFKLVDQLIAMESGNASEGKVSATEAAADAGTNAGPAAASSQGASVVKAVGRAEGGGTSGSSESALDQ